MLSEQQLIQQIEQHTRQLAQSVANVEFWYEQVEDTANKEFEEINSQIQVNYEKAMFAASQEYDDAIAKIEAKVAEFKEQTKYELSTLGWEEKDWQEYTARRDSNIPALTRIGHLSKTGMYGQLLMPALLPIIGRQNLVIKAAGVNKETVRAAIQSIMLRLIATFPPGQLRLVCIDPVGLGSTVAGFIKGLPDFLTGGYASYDPRDIEKRLADLEAHMAHVNQKYLGISYPSMEEYNRKAGQIEEPYRLLIVTDFPARFSETAAQRLISISTNGPATGVYTIAMIDTDKKEMPYGFNLSDLERTASIISCEDSTCQWLEDGLKEYQLTFDRIHSKELFVNIISQVGAAAITASEVKIPFTSLAPDVRNWWQEDSRAGVLGPIGHFGAKEVQHFLLDEKLLNSALIIGRQGSGKSTLLHTIINSLATTYPPTELELFLLDLKEVEFKDYAIHQLPHARVVAIDCEREFGLSVLRGLDRELRLRMDLFRENGVRNLSGYRDKIGTHLARILLIVDEFQELFSADDRLARDADALLARMVKEGRAFGINILLASQTLAGQHTISSATRNLIPIRIALQCSDADSRLILSDENDQARLLERPGEAIYNSMNGRMEGNTRFQVAWIGDEERTELLTKIKAQAIERGYRRAEPQIVFEGNAPAKIAHNRTLVKLMKAREWSGIMLGHRVYAWIGEPVEIRPHTAAIFRRQSRSNLLILGQNEYEESAVAMLSSSVLSLASQQDSISARFVLLNMTESEGSWHSLPGTLARALPHVTEVVKRRDMTEVINGLAKDVSKRIDTEIDEQPQYPSIYFVIFGLHRARQLRRDEGNNYLSYGVIDAEEHERTLNELLALICREGPEVGVHTLVWCDTYSSLSRVFERREIYEFGLRVALHMGTDESRNFIDSEAASQLGPYRALLYDEERTGQLVKFRPYEVPNEEWVVGWGQKLKLRSIDN